MNDHQQTLQRERYLQSGQKQDNQSQTSQCMQKNTENDVDKVSIDQSKSALKAMCQDQQFRGTNYNLMGRQQMYQYDQGLNQIILSKLKDVMTRIRFKKYAKVLLDFTRKRMLRLLTASQLSMINDRTYFKDDETFDTSSSPQNQKQSKDKNRLKRTNTQTRFQTYLYQTEQQIIKKKQLCSFLLNLIPVFLPNSKFIEVWQAIKIISVLICFFSYFACFAFEALISDLFRLDMIFSCQIILLMDVFMNLNTGIYVKGVLCIDRYKILLYYKYTKAFYYDVACQFFTLSYFVFFMDQSRSRLAICFLLPIAVKYNDINIIIKKMKDRFLLDRKVQNIIELINLLKNILLISHVFACIWILAAKVSPFVSVQGESKSTNDTINTYNASSWIDLIQISNESWIIQYAYSYYFITVTMITVGYGDIKPTNIIEVITCTFLMMICCVIFGFTINSIGEIFQDFYSQEKKLQQKRYIIGNYMTRKGVARSTMKAVYEYLEYYWKEQSDENIILEQDIISQLSDGLKERLLAESNGIIFKESGIFRDNFSQEILLRCLPIIHEQRCTPDEVVYDAQLGDSDIWIYFIQKGELEVFIQQSSNYMLSRKITNQPSTIYKLKEGDCFGELAFFSGEQTKMSLRSINFSKLLMIKRSDFIKVLMEDLTEYEQFCMIRDKIVYQNDYLKLQKKCIACNDQKHDEVTCPRLHLSLNKGKIIGDVLYSIPHQKRVSLEGERFLQFKQSTLESLENNNNRLVEYINDKYEDLIQYEDNFLLSTPFSRFNPQSSQPLEIDVINQQQSDQLANSNFNINYLPYSEQCTSLTQNNFNIKTNLFPYINNNNNNNMNNGVTINEISSINQNIQSGNSLQFSKKKQISFKNQQSLIFQNKEQCDKVDKALEVNNSEDEDEGMKQEWHVVKYKQNLQNSFNLDKQYEKEQSISNHIRRSSIVNCLNLGDRNDAHLGTGGSLSINMTQLSSSSSQERLNSLKQQLMIRQNAKDLNSVTNLQIKQDVQSAIPQNNGDKLLSHSIQKQPYVTQIQDTNTKRMYQPNNLNEYSKIETFETFDLLQGQFEKLNTFINYFPRFNVKNVLQRISQKNSHAIFSKRGSLKIEFARNLLTQNQLKIRNSVLYQSNSILPIADKYKNYSEQRKKQNSKISQSFRSDNCIAINNSSKPSSIFRISGNKNESMMPSKYSKFNQNGTQNENENEEQEDNDYILGDKELKLTNYEADTPPHSEEDTNYKDVQFTYLKTSIYDFQGKDITNLHDNQIFY